MNIKQKMIAKKSIQKKKKTERNDKIREILNERDRQKKIAKDRYNEQTQRNMDKYRYLYKYICMDLDRQIRLIEQRESERLKIESKIRKEDRKIDKIDNKIRKGRQKDRQIDEQRERERIRGIKNRKNLHYL